MKYTTKDNWKYTANKGYYFYKGDVITDSLYLGAGSTIDEWEVITEAKKAEIEKAKAEGTDKVIEAKAEDVEAVE